MTGRRGMVAGAAIAIVFLLAAGGLVALALAGRQATGTTTGVAPGTPNASGHAYAQVLPAPELRLTDQDGRPFELASLRGRPVLVFFGYTHCPDVCPATVGILNEALAAAGDGPRAVFTTVDPERDDVASLRAYLRYLPEAYVGLTGTPAEVRDNADRWGVEYARQESGSAVGYGMAHTADVFLVDAAGRLRARYPFGITAEPIAADLRALLAETPPPPPEPSAAASQVAQAPTDAPLTPAPTAATPASTAPSGIALYPELISTSVWAGGTDPVILRVTDSAGRRLGSGDAVSVQLASFDGAAVGPPVAAEAVLPMGEDQAYFVAPLAIPSPGAWRLHLASGQAKGDIAIQALDQGASAPIGAPAPDIDTPTIDDVGGVVRAVTTEPDPDLRLSTTSTADARAMGKPYVIVIDSSRFKVSPACGRALTMTRFLLDRWADDVVFVHLEPFEYEVITAEPVLSGTLTDPPLNEFAAAWGLGDATWPAVEMPWIFVVDGEGVVRAKYTGLVGTADIDVILTQLTGGS